LLHLALRQARSELDDVLVMGNRIGPVGSQTLRILNSLPRDNPFGIRELLADTKSASRAVIHLKGNAEEMSVTTGSIGTADIPASSPSLHGLDGVNFFLAALLAGFGPYVAAYLAEQKWTQGDIGFVLTASSVAGLLSQVPGGELLDKIRSKRALVAVGVGIVILGALAIALRPSFLLVSIALVLQGMTGGFLGPAIAAISLGLVGYSALAERLGRNQRFASTGALVGAGFMGLVGYLLSYQAIFVVAAALGLPLFMDPRG
jgi:hypothetical protein